MSESYEYVRPPQTEPAVDEVHRLERRGVWFSARGVLVRGKILRKRSRTARLMCLNIRNHGNDTDRLLCIDNICSASVPLSIGMMIDQIIHS